MKRRCEWKKHVYEKGWNSFISFFGESVENCLMLMLISTNWYFFIFDNFRDKFYNKFYNKFVGKSDIE